MQPTATIQRTTSRFGARIGALALITIGAIVAAGIRADLEPYVVLLIGLVALAAFAVTREYGLAVGGGITTGLGTTFTLVAQAIDPSAAGHIFMLSLGGGFTGVWWPSLAAKPAQRHPWPLVPAAVLLAMGFSVMTGTGILIDLLFVALAVALVGAGLVILLRGDR